MFKDKLENIVHICFREIFFSSLNSSNKYTDTNKKLRKFVFRLHLKTSSFDPYIFKTFNLP